MWLLFVFIVIPIIEIGLFIQVGGLIGLWPTLLIVVATAIIGSAMVRSQGVRALGQIQSSLNRLDNPTEPLAHGAMILLSGILLLTPGFFTDAVGFALLVPKIRLHVFNFIRSRVRVQSFSMGGMAQGRPGQPQGDIIDGEFQEIDPDSIPRQPSDKPSGWTRD